jgi:hypothetical protein
MPPSTELPVWLRHAGAPRRHGGGGRQQGPGRGKGMIAALAVLLFAAGGGSGYLLASRPMPQVTAAGVPPVCAPALDCVAPAARFGAGGGTASPPSHVARRAKPANVPATPLLPLPERKPLDAAFEINANGAVELVQILGADAASTEVRRCYSSHLKKWRFPQALLRGEEKLLVNFVL